MKHNWVVTLILVGLFLVAQYIGLGITDHYLGEPGEEQPTLPLGIERPEMGENTGETVLVFFIVILLATGIAFLLAKFNAKIMWKIWFFLSVVVTLTIAFTAFLAVPIAFLVAIIFAFYKVFKHNAYLHNIGELFIYAGLAAIFVPILDLMTIIILLIIISVYDYISVRKTKHMIKLAKFQTSLKIFAGLMVPYKGNMAILGGGDIGFPLLFAGVMMKDPQYGLWFLLIPIFAAASLMFLFMISKKKKFYPAMPFITVGCLVGFGVIKLIQFFL